MALEWLWGGFGWPCPAFLPFASRLLHFPKSRAARPAQALRRQTREKQIPRVRRAPGSAILLNPVSVAGWPGSGDSAFCSKGHFPARVIDFSRRSEERRVGKEC